MESDLGIAIRSVRTSNQWSLLRGILPKIHRKLLSMSSSDPSLTTRTIITLNDILTFLHPYTLEELESHGIWIQQDTNTTKNSENNNNTIICINPSFARTYSQQQQQQQQQQQKEQEENQNGKHDPNKKLLVVQERQCSCHVVARTRGSSQQQQPEQKQETNPRRYFDSHAYNAGRHAPDNSPHQPHCLLWQPPSSGHLHSWRRGY